MTNPQTNSRRINVFLLLCLGVLLYILFTGRCSRPIENPPKVTSVKEQIKAVANDEKEIKRISDSFNIVLQTVEDNANKYYIQWQNEKVKHNMAERAVEDLLNNNEIVPDTCKALQQKYLADFKKLSSASQQKDNAAASTIKSLQQLSNTQKTFLSQKDTAYKKIKTAWDTCIANSTKLEKSVKQLKPRSYIYAGVSILGEPNKILNGYGIELGLTNKKGTSYGITATNLNNTINYGITIRKRLIKL